MVGLSALFKDQYQSVYKELNKHTPLFEISNTADIWVRDFMPIKNKEGEYILFQYFPKYLKNPKYKHLISNNHSICDALNLNYTYSELY